MIPYNQILQLHDSSQVSFLRPDRVLMTNVLFALIKCCEACSILLCIFTMFVNSQNTHCLDNCFSQQAV